MKVRTIRIAVAGLALLGSTLISIAAPCKADGLPAVKHDHSAQSTIQGTPVIKLGDAVQEEYDNWTPGSRTQVLLDTSSAKNIPAKTVVLLKNHSQANIL